MIKKDTIDYTLVSLIGLAGEMQTEHLYRLNYGKEYIRKAISRLHSNGCIKVYKDNFKKYLRLTTKCKNYLKANFPERFSDNFSGATSTKKIRTDPGRRDRYHRLGEILILLYLADVKIFADEKSLMKKTNWFTRTDGADKMNYSAEETTAEFYTSTELKGAGLFMNARTSRALGIIYSYPEVYLLYNMADGDYRWEQKTEESFIIRAHHTFIGDRGKYDNLPKLIFVGGDYWSAEGFISIKKGGIRKLFDIGNLYDCVFFLDSKVYPHQQLKYFINTELRTSVNDHINDGFGTRRLHRLYNKTEDGEIILDCTTCNLLAIKYAQDEIANYRTPAHIVFFPFQKQQIVRCFGTEDNVEYYEYDPSEILDT